MGLAKTISFSCRGKEGAIMLPHMGQEREVGKKNLCLYRD